MFWLILALVISGIGATVLMLRTRVVNRRPDVGAVSDQWVATHRSDRQDD
jgi:hypothetical protein